MSLINQMLKDLDARRATLESADNLGQLAKPVASRQQPRRILPAAVLLLGTGIVAAYYYLEPRYLEPRLVAHAPAPPVVAAQVPIADEPAVSDGQGYSLKLDFSLANVPLPSVTALAAIKPATEVETANVGQTQKSIVRPAAKALPAEAMDAPAAAVSAPAEIVTVNKQVSSASPKQQAEAEYLRAAAALQNTRMTDAVKGFEAALALDPAHMNARNGLVNALIQLHQPDIAAQYAREGLLLDPARTGLAMVLARLQVEKGQLRPAIETLGKSLPHAADQPEYRAFLAALLQRNAQHSPAIDHYGAALQKAPQNSLWWMGLGISLQAEERKAEALQAYRQARNGNGLSAELSAFVDARMEQLAH